VASVSLDATFAEVEELAVKTGFARFPVYQDRIDDIVGIVSLRHLLYEGSGNDTEPVGPATPIRRYVRRSITFIPESKPVGELLHELRYQRIPMAVVVDEHGGVTGILTLEDLVEEIVGDIQDERDRPVLPLTRIGNSQFECDGRLDIEDLEQHLNLEIEHNGFETAAGLALKIAGRIPQPGEQFDFGNYTLEILNVEKRRISRLRFRKKNAGKP
jgi:CBS domain containing-hemolysin-like protein